MSYPINYPTPQNANVQIFHSNSGSSSGDRQTATWIKPQGASFVWFTLIGPGGSGDGAGTSGGSGGVTNFMCPAFLIPDSLQVLAANPDSGSDTKIFYITTNASTPTVILRGGISGGTSGGSAMSANFFTAMGFFQSVAGESGSTGGVSASSTIFLSSGATVGNTVTANYGYTNTTNNRRGYFMLQPIIVGVGGIGTASGGIGCGGGDFGKGGNGLVVIITW
jgi:hypothetical protein